MEKELKINGRSIGNNHPPYIIAEIGVNHNGDLKEAKYLIKKAAECNCNAVKFQHRSENLYNESDINSCDLGTQYIIAELKRTRLTIKELKECTIFAKENNLDVIITAFDIPALKEITSEYKSNLSPIITFFLNFELKTLDKYMTLPLFPGNVNIVSAES